MNALSAALILTTAAVSPAEIVSDAEFCVLMAPFAVCHEIKGWTLNNDSGTISGDVTPLTQRHDVQPVRSGISCVVMVATCPCGAPRALALRGRLQVTSRHGLTNGHPSCRPGIGNATMVVVRAQQQGVSACTDSGLRKIAVATRPPFRNNAIGVFRRSLGKLRERLRTSQLGAIALCADIERATEESESSIAFCASELRHIGKIE